MPSAGPVGVDNESIIHFGGAKIRAVGNGTVDFAVVGLGNAEEIAAATPLASQTLDDFTFRTMTVLANFISQRVSLKMSTNHLSDLMICSRIIIYIKPIWTDYPVT